LSDETTRVEPLIREIEARVRKELRRKILAEGGTREFEDPAVFESVERLLRRAADRLDDQVLLPEFLGAESQWRLQRHLRLTSHRPVIGPLIVFGKRRILLPLMRWLYEFSAENFARQERMNRTFMACIEELAIDNARLRSDLHRLHERSGAGN
jgi:hypothetical protein